jgi:hypothetical protein
MHSYRILAMLLVAFGSAHAEKCFSGWYAEQSPGPKQDRLTLDFDPRTFLNLNRVFLATVRWTRSSSGVFHLSLNRPAYHPASGLQAPTFVLVPKKTADSGLFFNVKMCTDVQSKPVLIRAVTGPGEQTVLFVEPRP